MSFRVSLSGQLASNLSKLKKRLAPRVERGVRAAANVLMADARARCPKDTTALVGSSIVRKLKGGLDSEFSVGFGNRDFDVSTLDRKPHGHPHDYAVRVHEGNIQHPLKTGEILFLQNATEDAGTLAEMRDALNKAAGTT